MTVEQAIELVINFQNDRVLGYEMDDFLNSKQYGIVEKIRSDIQNEAMPLSFNRTEIGIEIFRRKLLEIADRYS